MLQTTPPQDWQLITDAGTQKLQREFSFADFKSALSFVNQAGELAETMNHHPAIELAWGKVTIWWWSHDAKGVTQRDFQAAEQTNALFKNFQ